MTYNYANTQVIYEEYQGTYAAVDSSMISKGICRKGHSLMT
jgi:hypothetical protein